MRGNVSKEHASLSLGKYAIAEDVNMPKRIRRILSLTCFEKNQGFQNTSVS